MRKFAIAVVSLFVAIGVLLIFGPEEPVDLTIKFHKSNIGPDVDHYLAQSESAFGDITEGTEKRVIWAGGPGQKTGVALIYLHGYSATSEEIRPVPDQLAETLGANLFYTRLAGHGRPGTELAQVSVNDWVQDLAEAIEIGRRIGDRVVLISTSTGGTLARLALEDPAMSQGVAGVIFVSPNFGLMAPGASLLTLPFARQFIPLLFGKERHWEASSPEQEKFWTTRYPTVSVFPMAALVRHSAGLKHSDVKIPALFLFSDGDTVVNPAITRKIAQQWGGQVQLEPRVMGPGDSPSNHVIAGDIQSPGQTAEVTKIMLDWINKL